MAVKQDEQTKKWFFYGRYKDLNGKTKQYKKRGFDSSRKAAKAEVFFLDKATKISSEKITVQAAFDEYQKLSKSQVKESTLYTDEYRYNKHIKHHFGEVDVSKLTVPMILQWQELLLETLSPAYIDALRSTLNKILVHCFNVYGIVNNSLKRVKKPKTIHDLNENGFNTWDYKEYSKFISCIDDLFYKLLFSLVYMTGLRRGELLALQWADFDGKQLNVYKTFSKSKTGFKLSSPKTKNSYRKIDLDNKTIILLKNHRNKMFEYDDFDDNKFIFGYYKPVSPNTVREKFLKYQINSEVTKIRFHDLRHSHVSLLINNKMPLPAIAARIGDTIETMLNTYSHLFDESNKEVIGLLNNLDKKYAKSMPKQIKH